MNTRINSKASTWIDFAAIVKSNLAQSSITPHPRPRQHHSSAAALLRSRPHQPSHTFRATTPPLRTTTRPYSQDATSSKPSRSNAASTSLRRVALDAQRSREILILGRGRRRHIDPSSLSAHKKLVTAYCAAETYSIPVARELLESVGYKTDPLQTGLGGQVLHVRTSEGGVEGEETGSDGGDGDIFIFPSGSVVGWNVPSKLPTHLVTTILPKAAENSHFSTLEVEDMQYLEATSQEKTEIIGDTIVLGLKQQKPDDHEHSSTTSEISTLLAKIAFSSALARSTKLAVLEATLSTYFLSTRSIPTTLSTSSPLRLTRSFILRKTGELLSIRAQLNLYSELTDSLPDLFWDSPSSLHLETYYETLSHQLDIPIRIKILNEKMDYASEIAAVLRERLSEKHSTGLEWLIIGLISIEVVFGVVHLWRESEEAGEVTRVRDLLEKFLEKEMEGKPKGA